MIQKTAIIGMGALGLLYADQITSGLGDMNAVEFVMDDARAERHKNDVYTINGVEKQFRVVSSQSVTPADLVIVSVKYPALHSALDTMAGAIDEHTIILSVMNGITSEQIIGARYGADKLLDSVALGMDAIREGSALRYTQAGRIHFGAVEGQSREKEAAVHAFFERAHVPHVVETDMLHRLWYKFMLNVGINQTCTAFGVPYGVATVEGSEPYERMVGAMREVIALAAQKGITLTEEEIASCVETERSLDPMGVPSMAQDRLARRPSEVEMFAGDVIRLSKPYGLPTPDNQFFYDTIRAIEAEY